MICTGCVTRKSFASRNAFRGLPRAAAATLLSRLGWRGSPGTQGDPGVHNSECDAGSAAQPGPRKDPRLGIQPKPGQRRGQACCRLTTASPPPAPASRSCCWPSPHHHPYCYILTHGSQAQKEQTGCSTLILSSKNNGIRNPGTHRPRSLSLKNDQGKATHCSARSSQQRPDRLMAKATLFPQRTQ